MRRVIVVFMWIVLLAVHACRSGNGKDTGTFIPDADYVQIVLFHLAQRCESCTAVEQETRFVLEEEYREDIESGRVRFITLNFQTENGKNTARLLQASGQTLFVVKGGRAEDLTSAAFMYASTHPEYYRKALRETLDKFLE
ncbi:MAG: nitrophenyl compound nitroreductase subunit ArsF family protein [Bacteroidales bacterium]|nr:nitrophenyl compound nitroreductase subunit ArsF family protein [Bacteroidales bacterium]